MEYFVYKNSQLLKPISFTENQFNFYSVFSTTFGQYIFPLTPIAVGYFLTGLLITFSVYKIYKKEKPIIYILLICYIITFSLSAKFYTIIFMGWWFYGMAMPMSIIIFAYFISTITNWNKKFGQIFILMFICLFLILNLNAIYKNYAVKAVQKYSEARYIAKIIGEDTKSDNFELYFYTKLEGDSRMNTHTPFVYLVAYNSQSKDLFLKSELRPNKNNFKYINVYVVSDISNTNNLKFIEDVNNIMKTEYFEIKKPSLIYRKGDNSIYKFIFLNTKKQIDEQTK